MHACTIFMLFAMSSAMSRGGVGSGEGLLATCAIYLCFAHSLSPNNNQTLVMAKTTADKQQKTDPPPPHTHNNINNKTPNSKPKVRRRSTKQKPEPSVIEDEKTMRPETGTCSLCSLTHYSPGGLCPAATSRARAHSGPKKSRRRRQRAQARPGRPKVTASRP